MNTPMERKKHDMISLKVKLLTIWTDEKQRWEESEKRREEERRSQKRKSQKKEDPGARKGKSQNTVFFQYFPMICGSGGSESRLAKAAGAEPAGQMRDEKLHAVATRRSGPLLEVEMSKKCTPLWREAHFEVKMLKTPGSKCSDHFWTFRCRFAWQAQELCTLSKVSNA